MDFGGFWFYKADDVLLCTVRKITGKMSDI